MGRSEQELDTLERISQILSGGLELGQVFQHAVAMLGERMNITQAALCLWDDAISQARIVAAVGLTKAEIERGRYGLGEGVTGRVLATGQPAIIPDLGKHPEFLNRTGSRDLAEARATAAAPIAFICVPIKEGDRVIGAMSIDKPFIDEALLASDARLIAISMFAVVSSSTFTCPLNTD